jgi:sec-independent protein translocase protein TatB
MLDIGFFELLVVGVVLIIVLGPERLPEVAKQAAFFIRKARQGMFRLRSEMKSEIQGTPFADLEKAKQEMADLKNDLRQFGREIVDSADQKEPASQAAVEMKGKPIPHEPDKNVSKAD